MHTRGNGWKETERDGEEEKCLSLSPMQQWNELVFLQTYRIFFLKFNFANLSNDNILIS